MRLLYTLLLYLITPLILLRLLWRGLELRDYWYRWGERFGWVRASAPVKVWVHAVSVGEAIAALPLIRAMLAEHGPGGVLVTSTTPTGSARVRETLGDSVQHLYSPYDLPHVVARFLKRMQPQRVIIMETELWPNLFAALSARNIPLHIVNARLSPGSFAGYQRVHGFTAATLAACTGVLAQSEADAQRFRELGAPAERVVAVGNIKFDQQLPACQLQAGQELRLQLGPQRFVWAAVSTHDGEEAAALAAHSQLRKSIPDALLILVPRHPQRFDAVADAVDKSGLPWRRRSQPDRATPASEEAAVLLGDSMGEMFTYLSASDLVFVGGSLVPVGGHNVLEPAALGKPILFGPHMFNFIEGQGLLLAAGAARQLSQAEELGTCLTELAADGPARITMGAAALRVVRDSQGALARILERLAR